MSLPPIFNSTAAPSVGVMRNGADGRASLNLVRNGTAANAGGAYSFGITFCALRW